MENAPILLISSSAEKLYNKRTINFDIGVTWKTKILKSKEK